MREMKTGWGACGPDRRGDTSDVSSPEVADCAMGDSAASYPCVPYNAGMNQNCELALTSKAPFSVTWRSEAR